MKRARFGQSSEKISRQIDLLELVIGDMEAAEAEDEARTASTSPAGQRAVPVSRQRN